MCFSQSSTSASGTAPFITSRVSSKRLRGAALYQLPVDFSWIRAELMGANGAHVKNVPGRRTAANDATCIADLTARDLIRASFVPEQASHIVSGRRMIEGERNPIKLAELADRRIKASSKALYDALSGAIMAIDQQPDAAIAHVDQEVAATVILAEIGRHMSRFPTSGHLVAWAGLCPVQAESAGKRKSPLLRK
jgi:transposase